MHKEKTVDMQGVFASYSWRSSYSGGVRPVVSLDAKIRLQDSGTIKDGCKLYNIVIE